MTFWSDLFNKNNEEVEKYHYDRTHPHKVQTVEEYLIEYQKYNSAYSGVFSPPKIEIKRG